MQLTKHSGISLAEVLTAVLVLALAVIGAAGLQWRALRAAHDTNLQSTATRIAADLAEGIRAFHDSTFEPGYGISDTGFAFDTAAGSEPAVATCFAAACAPAQFVASELQDASRRVRELLPEGRLRLCRDATPWDAAPQALTWDCSAQAAGAAPVVVKIGWRSRQAAPAGEVRPLIALTVVP